MLFTIVWKQNNLQNSHHLFKQHHRKQMRISPSTSTVQQHSALPAAASARHLYCPSSSGSALSMVREHRPPATQHNITQHIITQQNTGRLQHNTQHIITHYTISDVAGTRESQLQWAADIDDQLLLMTQDHPTVSEWKYLVTLDNQPINHVNMNVYLHFSCLRSSQRPLTFNMWVTHTVLDQGLSCTLK